MLSTKRTGTQRRAKEVHDACIVCTVLQLAKGMSLGKATLNGEEIKPGSLNPLSGYAWLEASVSQLVGSLVSHLVSRSASYNMVLLIFLPSITQKNLTFPL